MGSIDFAGNKALGFFVISDFADHSVDVAFI
jgi:hypothetical protein